MRRKNTTGTVLDFCFVESVAKAVFHPFKLFFFPIKILTCISEIQNQIRI